MDLTEEQLTKLKELFNGFITEGGFVTDDTIQTKFKEYLESESTTAHLKSLGFDPEKLLTNEQVTEIVETKWQSIKDQLNTPSTTPAEWVELKEATDKAKVSSLVDADPQFQFIVDRKEQVMAMKEFVSNVQVPGSPRPVKDTYAVPSEMNPFMQFVDYYPVTGDSLAIPVVEVGAFVPGANQAALAAVIDDGELSADSSNLVHYVAGARFTNPAMEQVAGIRDRVLMRFQSRAGENRGKVTADVLRASGKSGNAGTIAQFKSGVGGSQANGRGIPDVDKVKGVIENFLAELPMEYFANAVLVLNRKLYARLREATTSNSWGVDPRTNLTMWAGIPILTTGYMEQAAANNDVIGLVGDLMEGVVFAERQNLRIIESLENLLGSTTYLASSAFVPIIQNADAIRALVAAA